MQAQLWPTNRNEIERATEHGIEDIERIWSIDDLAPTEVIVAATVSPAAIFSRVRYLATAHVRTRLSCAPAVTGFASWTAFTSSPVSA